MTRHFSTGQNLTPGPSPKERGEERILQIAFFQDFTSPLSPGEGPGVRFCPVLKTRHFFVGLLLLLSTTASAGEPAHARLEKRIEDDGTTLSIKIDGFVNGREIRYQQAFDVADMNDLQKELLKCRVYHSQGLGLPLHEMPGLLFGVPALAALLIGLLVAGARAAKAPPANPQPYGPGR